jgi:hypothetical protein
MAKNTTPPPAKKMEIPSQEDCAEVIRKALRRQQTYSDSLEPTIQMAAGTYHVYLKTLFSVGRHKKAMYSVLTREGSTAHKLYPDIEFVPSLTRALQLALRSLGLTLDTLTAADEDPLDSLANMVNEEISGNG